MLNKRIEILEVESKERLEEKDKQILQLEGQLRTLKHDRQSLTQSIKGLKSGSVRKGKKIARLEVSSAAAVPLLKGVEKKVSTKIDNVCENDIIVAQRHF